VVLFSAFHSIKMFWLLPAGALSEAERWAVYGTTLVNVAAAGVAVHLVIRLRTRLEEAYEHVRAQAEELRAQGEELAQQNEELAEQAEELTQQGEELARQN